MDTMCNKPRKQILAIISFLFLSFIFSANNVSAADGAKIFKQNCAVCHSLGTNKLTGPGLAGIATRAPGDEWLKKWIKNSDALRKSGDAYAVKVYNDNNQVPMSAFEFLSDEELTSLIEYIKAPPVETPKGNSGATGDVAAAVPAEQGMNPLALLIGVIVFLIVIVAVLRGVRFSLKNLQNEKQGLPLEEAVGPWTELKSWMSVNKTKTDRKSVV